MFVNNPFPGAFGLDIGDLSIKLIQLKQRRRPFQASHFDLETLRTVKLPPGYIVNGEIQQPEMVRKKILHLLGEDGAFPKIKSPWVVADLPEPKTFLKLIEIGTPAAELTADDVIYQAGKHLPFDLEETYLDWQVVANQDQEDKNTHVLLGAAPKIIADSYTYLLEACGLNPLALEIEAIALARAMITGTKDYAGIARIILDLGATRSSVIIYDKEAIQFSASINCSGELLTTALSQELKVDRETAEKLKIKNGARYDKEHPTYLNAVSAIIDKLAEEISRALLFYQGHFKDANPITHITMCGGLANWENLDNILSHKLRIPAAPGNAWKNIADAKITEEKRNQGLVLASAIGLALRAAANPLQNTL